MPDFFVSVRNIKNGGFGREPSTTRFLRIPARAKNPVPAHKMSSKKDWVEQVMAEGRHTVSPGGEECGDVLVFVHGYNNEPHAVLERHRLIKKNLKKAGFRGSVVSFDWPSDSKALNYLEDRGDARQTSIKLVDDCIKLFVAYQRNDCVFNLHLLCHSTGAYVVREAFDDADDRRYTASTNWTVSQIAFISADVSAKSLGRDDCKSSSLYRHCVRLTNYQNPYDSILKLSNVKRVGVAPRVGRVGLPDHAPGKAVNVNCGPHFAKIKKKPNTLGAWDHSWQFDDPRFMKDLALTLQGDVDRDYIVTRNRLTQGGGLYLSN